MQIVDVKYVFYLLPLIQCERVCNLLIITPSIIVTLLLVEIRGARTWRLIWYRRSEDPVLVAQGAIERVEIKIVHIVNGKGGFIISNLLNGVGNVDGRGGQVLVSDCSQSAGHCDISIGFDYDSV
jgi:hypothetical protein